MGTKLIIVSTQLKSVCDACKRGRGLKLVCQAAQWGRRSPHRMNRLDRLHLSSRAHQVAKSARCLYDFGQQIRGVGMLNARFL